MSDTPLAPTGPAKSSRNFWLFLLPSLAGVFLFMTPVPYGDDLTIPVAVLAKALQSLMGEGAPKIVTALIVATAVITVLVKLFKPNIVVRHAYWNSLFNVSKRWALIRVVGALASVMTLFAIGPEAVHSGATGGLVLNDLLPVLLCVFGFAGLLLPLLVDFGLLELVGTLMTKLMRPVFNLPGRSAVDCFASWVGDGSVGVLMTSKQYEQGFYTQREAAVIGTTFSIVSITFSLVVIGTVGLESHFLPFFATVCLSGFVAAIIVPRLPPLRNKADTFVNGEHRKKDDEMIPAGQTAFQVGMHRAKARAANVVDVSSVLKSGGQNALDMVLGILPVVMAIGTVALIVAEHTPIFDYLGQPFVPLLELMNVPEAEAASRTILVGFADMFLPAILAADIQSDMTRFIIAALSVSQLIYMSEVGALMLGSSIPVSLGELLVIFVLRTLVVLPVIVLMAHWLF